MTICRGPLLPIEDASDHTIGEMGGEPAQQRDLGRLKSAQALLPATFEAARHQPVVGIDSAIATLGTLRFVIGSLDPEPPLLQSGFALDFQPLSGGKGGGKPSRLQCSAE